MKTSLPQSATFLITRYVPIDDLLLRLKKAFRKQSETASQEESSTEPCSLSILNERTNTHLLNDPMILSFAETRQCSHLSGEDDGYDALCGNTGRRLLHSVVAR